jgi:hypothetical protein
MLSGGVAGGHIAQLVRAVDTERDEDSGSIPLVPEGRQKPLLSRTVERGLGCTLLILFLPGNSFCFGFAFAFAFV